MAFALQKRCSTTELSRRCTHGNHPQGQFQTVVAARFHQCVADVTFDGAVAQNQAFCDGSIAQPLQQKRCDPELRRGESIGWSHVDSCN